MRTHRIYKVYDGSGTMVFRGSVPEIAEQYYIHPSCVYKVARGEYLHFLSEFSLEYDGWEAIK